MNAPSNIAEITAVPTGTSRRHFTAMLASLGVVATGARAQAKFPDKPITMMVPYGTGTITDVIARQVSTLMTGLLGQPMVVENKPGASAQIGTQAVARSAPDGYTLLMGGDHTMCVNPAQYKNLTYNPTRDFIPVAGITMLPLLLTVSASLPVRSVPELVALAKAKPGTLTFASPGIGTPAHLLGELFKSEAKVDLLHVPYQGAAQLLPDLMEGRISMMFYPYQPLKTHIDSGKLRALASTTEQRVTWLRDVPTFPELGYPKILQSSWLAVYAPAGTPVDRVAQLSEAFKKVMGMPDIVGRLESGGIDIRYRTAAEQGAFATAQMSVCEHLVKIAGARMD